MHQKFTVNFFDCIEESVAASLVLKFSKSLSKKSEEVHCRSDSLLFSRHVGGVGVGVGIVVGVGVGVGVVVCIGVGVVGVVVVEEEVKSQCLLKQIHSFPSNENTLGTAIVGIAVVAAHLDGTVVLSFETMIDD